jgi:copper transport protein
VSRGHAGRAAAPLVLLALVAALLLGTAGPAQAHATLVGSDPVEGAVLAEAPEQVTFTFNEAVAAVPDGVHVFDAEGDEVDAESSVTDAVLTVELTEPVGEGTLVVVWRIVSDDGHPVSGSLRFSVGAPSANVVTPETGGSGAADPPVTLRLLRGTGYVGLLLATGLVAFVLLVLPGGQQTGRARHRLVRVARAAAGVAAGSWLLLLPVVASYQLGGGLDLVGRASTWSALARTEYAVAALVVLGTVAAVALLGTGEPQGGRRTAAVVAAGLAVTAPALTGHSRAESPEALVVAVDVLHLLAGSVWLGGVVALALVLPDLAGRGTLAAETLARFSALAAGVLALLVATGTVLAWRIVGSWSALVETDYGRLLLAKIATAVVAVLLAAWNRRALLPRMQEVVRRKERRAGAGLVAKVVTAEAAVLGLVLVLTALLVDQSPEPDVAVAGPAVETVTLGEITAKATVSSPAAGPSAVTLELVDAAGQPTEGYAAPTASLSTDELDLGDLPLENVGPGVYTAQVVFPTAGAWDLQVSLRTSEFDNPVTSVAFTVD